MVYQSPAQTFFYQKDIVGLDDTCHFQTHPKSLPFHDTLMQSHYLPIIVPRKWLVNPMIPQSIHRFSHCISFYSHYIPIFFWFFPPFSQDNPKIIPWFSHDFSSLPLDAAVPRTEEHPEPERLEPGLVWSSAHQRGESWPMSHGHCLVFLLTMALQWETHRKTSGK